MSYRPDMLILAHKEFEMLKIDGMDERWATALLIAEKGDIAGAASLVIEVLEDFAEGSESESHIIKMHRELMNNICGLVIGTLSNLNHVSKYKSPKVMEMIIKAVDVGFVDCAYNAANHFLTTAKNKEDWIKAEHYFKISIATAKDDSSKASSLVNYCPIVRDGMIAGKKDFPGAVAIYEEAANLGLLIGMYNTANVCTWIGDEGDLSWIPKAVYWFETMMTRYEQNQIVLEMDDRETLKGAYNAAHIKLANIHIRGLFPEADFEYGLQLLQKCEIMKGTENMVSWLTSYALDQRISKLSMPEINSTAHNWHYVLSAIGWELSPVRQLHEHLEIFMADANNRSIPVIAIHVLMPPDSKGATMATVKRYLNDAGIFEYLLVSQIAMFKVKDKLNYTAMSYVNGNKQDLISVKAGVPLGRMIDAVSLGTSMTSTEFGANSCAIPIAVNLLAQGKEISSHFNFGSQCTDHKGWYMPFHESVPRVPIAD